MNCKNFLTGLASGLFFCLQMTYACWTTEAFEPKAPAKDVLHILGFYYGNGENILIREAEGNLELLYRYAEEDKCFAKANRYPLSKLHFDSYTINEAGPLGGSETPVHFDRDPDGYGITCRVGGHMYTRAFFGYTQGERQKVYVLPSHTEEEWTKLRTEAGAAAMPKKLQQGLAVELVNAKSIAGLSIKSVYGGQDNLFKHALYDNEELYVARQVAEALTKVQESLARYGYGLILYDAYRPWHISKLATLALPQNSKSLLEDPERQGSPHNTGLAVDVSLVDLATGEALEMPSAFDEPSLRQFAAYAGGTSQQRYRRELLRSAMQAQGFKASATEWWHFELGKISSYAHLNTAFAALNNE